MGAEKKVILAPRMFKIFDSLEFQLKLPLPGSCQYLMGNRHRYLSCNAQIHSQVIKDAGTKLKQKEVALCTKILNRLNWIKKNKHHNYSKLLLGVVECW